jgi:hypothetical protein
MKTINSFKDLEFEFIDLEDSLYNGGQVQSSIS